MNYKLKKDIVIKAGTIFKEDKELPEDVILDLEIEDKEGHLLGTVFFNIPEEFNDNWESWLEPESVNSDTTPAATDNKDGAINISANPNSELLDHTWAAISALEKERNIDQALRILRRMEESLTLNLTGGPNRGDQMNYKLKKDIVIKAGTIFRKDKELPENAILDLEIENKEGLLLGTVYVYIPEDFKDNWESWLEPESVYSDKHQENIAEALGIDKVKTPKKKTD